MTTTSTPTTFSDLYTDAINRVRANSSDSGTVVLMKRYINQGLHDVHIQQNWTWSERESVIITHEPYTDGTVTIAGGSRTTVTGSSTLWNTANTDGYSYNNARVGGKIIFAGGPEIYTVSAVGSDTSITLTSSYIGDALSGATYTYFEDEYALASDFWRLQDARKFSDALNIPVINRQEFYRRYARNSSTGVPRNCTIVEHGPGFLATASSEQQPRIIFHPVPDMARQIPYRYITRNLAISSTGTPATNLSSDTDEPIIPLRYRYVLVFYAISQWYRDRKDDARSQEANGEYVDLVRRMAGDSAPERDHPRFISNRREYARGAAGFGRMGRYSTNSAFDEIRDR